MVSRRNGAVFYVPALVGTTVCLGVIQSGFLVLLFLAPLGVLAFSYNRKTAWFAAVLTAAGNGLFAPVQIFLFRYEIWSVLWETLYFTVMLLGFTWITAPPLWKRLRIPTAYRLAIGAIAGSLIMLPAVFMVRNDTGMYQLIRTQAETLVSLYAPSPESGGMTADQLMEILGFIALRGGAAASCMAFFMFSRQAALIITWFIRRTRPGGSIVRFHLDFRLIWILSGALAGILLGSIAGISPLEIAAWNILTLCAILYLIQGGGIVMYFFARLTVPSIVRAGLLFLFFMVVFTPRINAFVLGALVLLGIAENWVPFRAPKSNGSSSTPGM
jgi:hypothetical protein